MNKLCFIVFLFLIPFNSNEKNYKSTTISKNIKLHGIDVSYHQKKIRWSQLKNINFAFIKATEGISIRDPKFKQNWNSCKDVGILRGAYHFYRPYVPAEAQFRHFKSIVKLEPGDLPPVLDAEIHSKNPNKLKRDFKKWLLLVENHYGMRPIIYCNTGFYKKYFKDSFFRDYKFWIANYVTDDLNQVHSNWDFWQYTSKGRVRGISSYVDKNIFNGSYHDLLAICKKK